MKLIATIHFEEGHTYEVQDVPEGLRKDLLIYLCDGLLFSNCWCPGDERVTYKKVNADGTEEVLYSGAAST